MKTSAPKMIRRAFTATHIETGYAYPTSPIATKHGMGKTGCWFVRVLAENAMIAQSAIVSAHATKEEAVAAAHRTNLTPAYWMLADWQERHSITGHGCMSAWQPNETPAWTRKETATLSPV